MGRNSTIEWTHHTFNPWWGCAKVSDACLNCYAEAMAKRTGSLLWGTNSDRRFFGEKHWAEPLYWNKEAERQRRHRRVFCASMADLFEDRADLASWRERVWKLIQRTPWLRWLLLTKRPENVKDMVPWESVWPDNVWLGVTAENQEMANKRVTALSEYPAVVRFVSCEPLLAPVDLSQWLYDRNRKKRIDWVIAGGESGSRARPVNPAWVRTLRDQCLIGKIPFHFKQWGTWLPLARKPHNENEATILRDESGQLFWIKKGKKAAGRELDRRIWDGVPA